MSKDVDAELQISNHSRTILLRTIKIFMSKL